MLDYEAILKEAISENPNDLKWNNSPYGGIKLVSNTVPFYSVPNSPRYQTSSAYMVHTGCQ